MIEKQRYTSSLLWWLSSFKVTKLVFLLLGLVIGLPILNHYLLNETATQTRPSNEDNQSKRNQLFYEKYNLHDFNEIRKQDNLEQRLTEIFKIRESILNELVYLENRRRKQQEEITSYALKLDEIKSQIVHKQNELTRIHLSVEQAEYSRKEIVLQQNRPFISNPLRILDDSLFQVNLTTRLRTASRPDRRRTCSMHHCFDYSKCPLIKRLNVYLDRRLIDQSTDDDFTSRQLNVGLLDYCESNFNLISEPDDACLIVLPILSDYQMNLISNEFENRTNVLIINFGVQDHRSQSSNRSFDLAMIAQNNFVEYAFRNRFDIILPSVEFMRQTYKLNQLITSTVKRYPHCPAKRKYFVSCVHDLSDRDNDQATNRQLVSILNGIFNNSFNKFDTFYLNFNHSTDNLLDEDLLEIYSQSTYTLLLPDSGHAKISSEQLHRQLASVLRTSSIPILLGDYQIELPFNEGR